MCEVYNLLSCCFIEWPSSLRLSDAFCSGYFLLHSTRMKCPNSEHKVWWRTRMEMLQLSVKSGGEMFNPLLCWSTSWITAAWLCYQVFISWSDKLLWRWSRNSDLSGCPWRGQSGAILFLKGECWCCCVGEIPPTEALVALWEVTSPSNTFFSQGIHFTGMM